MLLTLDNFGFIHSWRRRLSLGELIVYPCSDGITEHTARELCGRLQILGTHLVARKDVVAVDV